MAFPFSLSLAMLSFIASFLFLLANTFASTPLTFGSFFSFSVGGGGGGRLAAASAFLSPTTLMVSPNTVPTKTSLHHQSNSQQADM
ncbi:hypothetical protein Hanom_Chr02g00177911 [Helianthus anomalus]